MKKGLLVLFILLGSLVAAGTIAEDIAKLQADINKEQREIDEDRRENRIKYGKDSRKLAEKNAKLDEKQREVDYDKAKLQFMKDNRSLAQKRDDKKREIHLERRKFNSDYEKIERLMIERDAFEDEYRAKELKFEENYYNNRR